MSIKKETVKAPPKGENAENKGGVKCRIYKAKIPQKLSRLRFRLNLPSKADYLLQKLWKRDTRLRSERTK